MCSVLKCVWDELRVSEFKRVSIALLNPPVPAMSECPASPSQSDAWDLIKDEWSSTEMSQTVMLVTKARRLGVMDNVMKTVYQEELLCAQNAMMAGSMDDSAKRLRDASSGDGYASSVTTSKVYTAPPCDTWSHRVPMPTAVGSAEVMPLNGVILPEGVISMDEWGRSMVSFGKFKGKKCYYEILMDNGEEMMGYKKYLYDHHGHGSSQLRDLTAFLMASGYQHGKSQRPMIPGTSIVREFKR